MKFLFVTILALLEYEGERPFSQVVLTLDYPKNDTFRMRIHPFSGDDLYIERVFDSNNYCLEKIFRKGQLVSKTELRYISNHQLDGYKEFFIAGNKTVETRWRNDGIYPYGWKNFPINDSLSFEISYYANGLIASCGLKSDFCYYSNVYNFDTMNRTYWTGSFSSKRMFDTVFSVDNSGENKMKVYYDCSKDSIGSWRKVNAVGRILEVVKPKN